MNGTGDRGWALPVAGWRVRAIGAAAGMAIALSAVGQTTHIFFERSTDSGQTWSIGSDMAPGMIVHVRMRVMLEGATAIGLAGLTCQPVVRGWSTGDFGGPDVLQPFTFPGLDADGNPTSEAAFDGNAVRPQPQTNTGRMFPFGSGGQGVGSASGVLTGHVGPDDQLWFAGSRATIPGAQPQFGVSIAQLPVTLAGTNFDANTNTVVFRFAIQTNSFLSSRTVTLANLSEDRVYWYQSSSGGSVLQSTNVVVHPLVLAIIPSPGAIGLMAVAGLASARRRRSNERMVNGVEVGL